MQDTFDVIEAINDKIVEHKRNRGVNPSSICLSPRTYRRLLEMRVWRERIGNLVVGCKPITGIETNLGKFKIVLDEMLSETEVETE